MVALISHKELTEAFPVLNYEKPKPTWLGHLVRWVKEATPLPSTAKTILAYASAITANVLSLGLLIPITLCIRSVSRRIDAQKAADAFYEQVARNCPLPPPCDPIVFKSQKRTFNHINEYAIEHDLLWYRRKTVDPLNTPWKPIYFDGTLAGRKPSSLSADGANLIVIDDHGDVHYRKVLIEARRGRDDLTVTKFARHLKAQTSGPSSDAEGSYVVIDKTEKSNWKPSWFSLPGVCLIVNAVAGPHLRLQGGGIISHRGRFNAGYTDAAGTFQESDTGVTTLYALDGASGHIIKKFDPWAPKVSLVELSLPETPKSSFIASSLDVSASTLFTIGYTVDVQSKRSTLAVMTNLMDIDTAGGNLFLNYYYQSDPKGPETRSTWERCLADRVDNNGWIEHALPVDAAEFYNQITILQTGQGNDARELRIAARHKDGRVGYYYKTLAKDSAWTFEANDSVDTTTALPATKVFQGPIEHYSREYANDNVRLTHFGRGIYHSMLRLTYEGKQYDLPLHRRLGLGVFLGAKHDKYELILPKDLIFKEDPLLKAFGGQRVITIHLREKKDSRGKAVIHLSCFGLHPPLPQLSEVETQNT